MAEEQKEKELIIIKLGDKSIEIKIRKLTEVQMEFVNEIDNESKYQSET